jgi:hypothetical protein
MHLDHLGLPFIDRRQPVESLVNLQPARVSKRFLTGAADHTPGSRGGGSALRCRDDPGSGLRSAAKDFATRLAATEELDKQASDRQAMQDLVRLMLRSARTGRVKFLPGLTLDTALVRLQENLEVGRAPYLNIFEVRPCPDLTGQRNLRLWAILSDSAITSGPREFVVENECLRK